MPDLEAGEAGGDDAMALSAEPDATFDLQEHAAEAPAEEAEAEAPYDNPAKRPGAW